MAYWIVAAVVLVLLVIGVALWYSATTTTPGIPNTGTLGAAAEDYSSQETTNTGASSIDASGSIR